MEKTIDERLFDVLMRVPHKVRRLLMEAGLEMPRESHPPCPPHEMEGHHRPKPLGPPHGPCHVPEPPERRTAPSFARERVLLIIGAYVRRSVDPSDKRATLIHLTELGEARNAELCDERNERYHAVFATLSHEEKVQLLALLEKITVQ